MQTVEEDIELEHKYRRKSPRLLPGSVSAITKEQAGTDKRRIPSSSEDFTLATTTSEVKGRKTTILNTTRSHS
jgi:hypothetical protein